MVEFKIKELDQYEVAKLLSDSWKKAPQVMSKAINLTINDVRDLLQKRIQETYSIKSSGFRKAWKKSKIYKSKPNDMTALIRLSGRRLSMTEFIVNPTKRPNIQPEYYSGKFLVKTTLHNFVANNGNKGFIAIMKNGHQGIFYRVSTSNQNRKLAEITAPALPQMAKDEKNVNSAIQPKINELLQKNVQKLIKKELLKNE